MRLIDADKVEKEWKEQLTATYQDDYGKGFQAGLIVAVRQPTVDAEPVRHGHWILYDNNTCQCSVCEQCFDEPMSYNKYCPNCGAKMNEVTENGNK